jgi:hypothetical protein
VKTKKTPTPQRVGTADHQARFARILRAAGDDPASLLLMIAVMERIISERPSRREPTAAVDSY